MNGRCPVLGKPTVLDTDTSTTTNADMDTATDQVTGFSSEKVEQVQISHKRPRLLGAIPTGKRNKVKKEAEKEVVCRTGLGMNDG